VQTTTASHTSTSISTSTSTIASSATTSGRNNSIRAQSLAAGFPDLASAFGANQSAMPNWRDLYGAAEQGIDTFDGLADTANYANLTNIFSATNIAVESQSVESGVNAGPTNTLGGHDN